MNIQMNIHKKLALLISLAAIVAGVMLVIGSPAAQATPSRQRDCSQCHGDIGVYTNAVTAVPSTTTPAPGATYTVAIGMHSTTVANNGASGTGYWIANSNASGATGTTTAKYAGGPGLGANGIWTATMTAPVTPGTHFYKVFGVTGPDNLDGHTGFALYSITVSAPPTDVAPAITTQPASQTVLAGASVSFSAAASGTPDPTVQWQVSTNGGTSFSDVAGATSATYGFTSSASDNGKQYRAVFTNVAGSATSNAATLTVSTPPPPPAPISGNGQQLYTNNCSVCHEKSSSRFVGKEIYGESAGEISKAMREKRVHRSLASILSSQNIQDIAKYLKTVVRGDKDERDRDSDEREKDHDKQERIQARMD